MVEVGIAKYFGIEEALGIIGTMFIVLYFSRKHMQRLTVDIETKVLNDLDERMQTLTQMTVDRPELVKILNKDESDWTPEMTYVYHILYTFAHVYHMWQRKVLRDNEWTGWLRWMRTHFVQGKIIEYWKSYLELEKWFDPAFEEFINKEIIPTIKVNK
jgi:hypothetical protein